MSKFQIPKNKFQERTPETCLDWNSELVFWNFLSCLQLDLVYHFEIAKYRAVKLGMNIIKMYVRFYQSIELFYLFLIF